MNNDGSFKDFIFNNVSACIINTMLAVMFCFVGWFFIYVISAKPEDGFVRLAIFALVWAFPSVLYNYFRYKTVKSKWKLIQTIVIPYAIVLAIALVYFNTIGAGISDLGNINTGA